MFVTIESPFTANRSESSRDKERREQNDASARFESVATQLESLLVKQRAIMEDQGTRLSFMLAGGPDRLLYLDAHRRWHAAAEELENFISVVRSSIGGDR